jgi:UDP-N-acetylglucosamine--N-acetylmuramyl-(pentapeptide) pyrophosphoryl-undecaprenol N-acetylglucosamine transferase
VPERGYDLQLIPAVPLPRRPTPELITVPGRLRGTIKAAEQILERVGADALVGFGGYVALPGYLAAKRLGVPIVVHEANARPGLANKIGSRYTTHVAVSTPDSKLRHARYVGIPLRRAIATLDRTAARAEARAAFGLDQNLPTLLVSGGSQGARRLNEVAAAAAPRLQRHGVQILHAVGPKNELPRTGNMPGMPPYVAVPYLDRMDLAYAAADMMLCRAGAMTVAELSAVGLPAAYVPLPIGNGEQRLNAQPLVKAGGGLLVDDAELTTDWVDGHLLPVLTDPHRLWSMSRAAAEFGRRDADDLLAGMVHEAVAARRAR